MKKLLTLLLLGAAGAAHAQPYVRGYMTTNTAAVQNNPSITTMTLSGDFTLGGDILFSVDEASTVGSLSQAASEIWGFRHYLKSEVAPDYINLQAPAMGGGAYAITFPDNVGFADSVLLNNGAGALTWLSFWHSRTNPIFYGMALVASNSFLGFSSNLLAEAEMLLVRVGTNQLALTNATGNAPMRLHIYGGTSNSRLTVGAVGGNYVVQASGQQLLRFGANDVPRWEIQGVGATYEFRPSTDNLYDIGTSSLRVRDLYLARSVLLGRTMLVAETNLVAEGTHGAFGAYVATNAVSVTNGTRQVIHMTNDWLFLNATNLDVAAGANQHDLEVQIKPQHFWIATNRVIVFNNQWRRFSGAQTNTIGSNKIAIVRIRRAGAVNADVWASFEPEL